MFGFQIFDYNIDHPFIRILRTLDSGENDGRCGVNVLLMGDAAHAMVPFYGQGMNAVGEWECFLSFSLIGV